MKLRFSTHEMNGIFFLKFNVSTCTTFFFMRAFDSSKKTLFFSDCLYYPQLAVLLLPFPSCEKAQYNMNEKFKTFATFVH